MAVAQGIVFWQLGEANGDYREFALAGRYSEYLSAFIAVMEDVWQMALCRYRGGVSYRVSKNDCPRGGRHAQARYCAVCASQ